MSGGVTTIPEAWKKALSSSSFQKQLGFTLLGLLVVYVQHFYCLRIWESRQGVELNDLILNQLTPHDFSWAIFGLEYFTLLSVFIFLLTDPAHWLKGIQAFALVTLLRTTTIYFILLEPPRNMIILNDPFANLFLHSHNVFVTKDLFFSGHIATLTLAMLVTTNKYLKLWTTLSIFLVGTLLLWQHVHYSLDIFFAPVMAFVSYKLVLFVHHQARIGFKLQQQ